MKLKNSFGDGLNTTSIFKIKIEVLTDSVFKKVSNPKPLWHFPFPAFFFFGQEVALALPALFLSQPSVALSF